MYTMQNSSGHNLPLTVHSEYYAKKLLGLSPEIIREGIPDYGKDFKGDLVTASYTNVGDNATQYVEGEFGKAYKEILKKQTQAHIIEKQKEADYELLTNDLDNIGLLIFKHSFFIVSGILATYGIFWLTSLAFPVLLSYILTGVMGIAFVGFPTIYCAATVKFFIKNKKQTGKVSVLLDDDKELAKEVKNHSSKYTLPVLKHTLKPFTVKPSTHNKDYSYAMLAVLRYHYPYLFSVDDSLLDNHRIYICVNCGHATPVEKVNKVCSCISCAAQFKVTQNKVHLLTVDHEYAIKEKLVLSKQITRLVQNTVIHMMSKAKTTYSTSDNEKPLYSLVEELYNDLPDDVELNPPADEVIN